MRRTHWIFFGLVLLFLYGTCSVTCLHALSVDEIIKLKQAGVEDRTIQLIIELEKSNREGKEGLGVKEIPRPDGGKDRVYYSVTTPEEERQLKEEEKEKLERALEILQNIIIDERRR